jgi:two-component system alkaline phosphatase synthesis response regulator PhoP
MKKRVLVVDDEPDIIDLISYNLKKEGYEVLSAGDGHGALGEAAKNPDLIILDVMMPGLDGFEVCRRLKSNAKTAAIPVMFLTARSTEFDEIMGLEIGADDFIQKPISPRKLLVRVKTILRRSDATEETISQPVVIQTGKLEINRSNFTVRAGNRELFFPRKEFEILALLAANRGRVFSREMLLNRVWGTDVVVVDRTIDVHIRRIREKLGSMAGLLETVKGVGYRFRE